MIISFSLFTIAIGVPLSAIDRLMLEVNYYIFYPRRRYVFSMFSISCNVAITRWNIFPLKHIH